MRREAKRCPYCKHLYFPTPRKENHQIYCKPSHRKNAYRKRKRSRLPELQLVTPLSRGLP